MIRIQSDRSQIRTQRAARGDRSLATAATPARRRARDASTCARARARAHGRMHAWRRLHACMAMLQQQLQLVNVHPCSRACVCQAALFPGGPTPPDSRPVEGPVHAPGRTWPPPVQQLVVSGPNMVPMVGPLLPALALATSVAAAVAPSAICPLSILYYVVVWSQSSLREESQPRADGQRAGDSHQ